MPFVRPSRLFLAAVVALPSVALAQDEETVEYAEDEYVEDERVVEDEAPVEDESSDEEPAEEDDATRRRRFLAPQPSFTIHGYMRTRGEWQNHFALGRTADVGDATLEGYPFRYFLPIDRGTTVSGGCSSPTPSGGTEAGCFSRADKMRYANMRMRLAPSLALSDDVRVHMVVDVFDNMMLGSTPDASSYGFSTDSGELPPGVPLDFFSRTLNPAVAGRNSYTDSIYVRRAWAEVHNRDLGELRFGRMANHWGLGMLWNAGAGIDSDYSTDVDRVMISRDLFGYTFGAAWDFMDEGVVVHPGNLNGIPFDGSDHDDVRQFSFFAAQTMTPEEEAEALENGDHVLVGGLYYQYRFQDFGYVPAYSATGEWGIPAGVYNPGGSTATGSFVRRDATSHTLDGYARFRLDDLRIEFEGALVLGSIRNWNPGTNYVNDSLRLLQFGFALQTEYRAVDGHLGLFFDTGYATGDRDVDGLSIREDTITQDSQAANDGRASHFTFHPNYRIDLILFRNILGSVGGSYYFRPALAYDIRRTDAGGLLGIRADIIYSRAAQVVQTYGGDASLGLELDASVYYRSEDGPDPLDGFWSAFNFGILFPLDGLGYRVGEVTNPPKIGKAITMRAVLGVSF